MCYNQEWNIYRQRSGCYGRPQESTEEKLKTLSPEMLEAVGWLVEHWTVLKAIAAGEPLTEAACREEMGAGGP